MAYFNKFKIKVLGLDIQDDLGRHEVGFIEDTSKVDINDGKGYYQNLF